MLALGQDFLEAFETGLWLLTVQVNSNALCTRMGTKQSQQGELLKNPTPIIKQTQKDLPFSSQLDHKMH